jgi:hypothetical protein
MKPQNLTLQETARYFPNMLDPDIVADAMAELEAWRDVASDSDCYDPEELAGHIESLEESQANPDNADRDDLKEFFDDIVSAWEDSLASGCWPCAEAYDSNLRQAIIGDMQTGADALRAIEEFLATGDKESLEEFWAGVVNERG